MTVSQLNAGDQAPWFVGAVSDDPRDTLAFDEMAGRHIVLVFLGDAVQSEVADTIEALACDGNVFDGDRAIVLVISNKPDIFHCECTRQRVRGRIVLWDADDVEAKQYGVGGRPVAFIVDPALQIAAIVPFTDPSEFGRRIVSVLSGRLTAPSRRHHAPVLVAPRIFDPEFCAHIIELYEAAGGREIGVVEYKGNALGQFDPDFRRRLDWYIADQNVIGQAKDMIARRLLPIVYRAFQFRATRIERYLVGCYDAASGGHFRPHRDNTARPGAHRRFAVSINLNGDYEGGDLRFPEFSGELYRAAPGDAIVFSCSLLHEVRPVTRGRRYAFLSFIFDEQSQKMLDAFRESLAVSEKATAS